MSHFAELIAGVSRGDDRSLALAISLVEDGAEGAPELVDAMSIINRMAPIVGMTGAPGVGKSTLINALIDQSRKRQLRVAVLAVDPSSPVTGGALLGDRIRMQRHSGDDAVFIRSLGARGHLGGLTRTFSDVLTVMRAAPFDVILVETVGVGQSEVEIMKFADSVLVVTAPGLGDSVQAAKAGIFEIATTIVLNKSDLPGADSALAALKHAELECDVVAVSATTGAGIEDVAAAFLPLGGQQHS